MTPAAQQVLEVFNRLELGVSRAYCLTISNGIHPVFLANFYLRCRNGNQLDPDSALAGQLREELYNTQLLATDSPSYRELVLTGIMSGSAASLVNAMIAFCHTSLAHNQPDRYDATEVRRASTPIHNFPCSWWNSFVCASTRRKPGGLSAMLPR